MVKDFLCLDILQFAICNKGMGRKRVWGNQAARNLFNKYRLRGLSNDITYLEFLELTSSDCFYCGAKPSNLRKFPKGDTYLYNGLDKKIPNQGYILNNIVPCCWRCNKMKCDTPFEEFVELIKLIAKRVSDE